MNAPQMDSGIKCQQRSLSSGSHVSGEPLKKQEICQKEQWLWTVSTNHCAGRGRCSLPLQMLFLLITTLHFFHTKSTKCPNNRPQGEACSQCCREIAGWSGCSDHLHNSWQSENHYDAQGAILNLDFISWVNMTSLADLNICALRVLEHVDRTLLSNLVSRLWRQKASQMIGQLSPVFIITVTLRPPTFLV